MTVIQLNAGTLERLETGIVNYVPKQEYEIHSEEMFDLLTTINSLSDGLVPVLLDHTVHFSLTLDARLQLVETEYISAMGLMYSNRVSELAAKFFLSARGLAYPAKVFSDRDTAMTWLEQYC